MNKKNVERELIARRKTGKNIKKANGITLLALVITIIIIIILATVAISFIFGENGLITKAQQAKLQHEIETARETLTMILGDAFVEKKTNPEYEPNDFLDKFIEEREPNVYLEDDEIGLDGHIFDLDRSVPELGKYQGELTGPRIKEIKATNKTTNSVTVEVEVTNAEKATYTYLYKKDTEGEESWKEVGKSDSNTFIIEGLEDGEIYDIKVVVETSEGKTEGSISVQLGNMPQGTITFSNQQWVGDGTATVQINTSATGFTLQYKITDTGEWTTIENGGTITSLRHGNTVFGRLWDGKNESKDEATTKINDLVDPIISSFKSTSTTINSITVQVSASDGESGLATKGTYKYYLNDSLHGTSENNTYTYSGLSDNTTYTLKVVVTDNAGNDVESSNITQKTPLDNVAPVISNTTFSSKTTNSITVKATATDADNDNITYKLYTSTSSSSGFTQKASTSSTSGTQVTLTASGLSQYTTYYYYIEASDGSLASNSSTASVRTYCPGTGLTCNGPFTSTTDCSTCNGTGEVTVTHEWEFQRSTGDYPDVPCQLCGRIGGNTYTAAYQCRICGSYRDLIVCSNCLGDDKTVTQKETCSKCGGTGQVTQAITCQHGRTSTHSYCSHNKTSQHDD